MAFNVGQFKSAMMAGSSMLPTGWIQDVANDCYHGPNGEMVTRMEVAKHGNILHALIAQTQQTAPISVGAIGHPSIASMPMGANGPSGPLNVPSAGSLSISNSFQPANTLAFETDHGRITLNIKNGDLTLPVGMSRADGAREFWMGFQKHFNTGDTAAHHREIALLKAQIKEEKHKADEYGQYVIKETRTQIANKIRTKYNGQKLIMVKPEDLAKFIEDV